MGSPSPNPEVGPCSISSPRAGWGQCEYGFGGSGRGDRPAPEAVRQTAQDAGNQVEGGLDAVDHELHHLFGRPPNPIQEVLDAVPDRGQEPLVPHEAVVGRLSRSDLLAQLLAQLRIRWICRPKRVPKTSNQLPPLIIRGVLFHNSLSLVSTHLVEPCQMGGKVRLFGSNTCTRYRVVL